MNKKPFNLNDVPVEAIRAAFHSMIGMQVHTKGMFTFANVVSHAGRHETYAELGDMPYTIKQVVTVQHPQFGGGEPIPPELIIELVQDKSPKDFKKAKITPAGLMQHFYCKNTDANGDLVSISDLVCEAINAINSWVPATQRSVQQKPTAPTEGWGAWA